MPTTQQQQAQPASAQAQGGLGRMSRDAWLQTGSVAKSPQARAGEGARTPQPLSNGEKTRRVHQYLQIRFCMDDSCSPNKPRKSVTGNKERGHRTLQQTSFVTRLSHRAIPLCLRVHDGRISNGECASFSREIFSHRLKPEYQQ